MDIEQRGIPSLCIFSNFSDDVCTNTVYHEKYPKLPFSLYHLLLVVGCHNADEFGKNGLC